MEIITKICAPVIEREPICKELSEIKLPEKTNKVEFIFTNCGEFSKKTMNMLILTLKENVGIF